MANKFDVRLLDQSLFDFSKRVTAFSSTIRILSYFVGIVVLLLALPFQLLPFLIAFLSILADLIKWRSDHVKGVAKSLLRKLEYHDGYGWPISKSEISDILVRSPAHIRNSISYRNPEFQYFGSEETIGPRRTLENLVKSAWWSKHLAETAGHIFLAITILTIFGSITILIISIESIQNFSFLMSVSQIVTSTILLLFSLQFIRHSVEYYTFSGKAEQSESKANHLLQIQDIDKEQSIKILIEYQFSRNGAPLIPTFIWKARRATLNDLWNTYQKIK